MRLLFTALACLLLFSCNKYEDGPLFSLRTKKARLTGTWKLEKVNGTSPPFEMQLEFEFEKDGDYTESQTFGTGIMSDTTITGEWEFREDGEDLYLEHEGGGDYYNINRLTMNELILVREEMGIGIILELEKD